MHKSNQCAVQEDTNVAEEGDFVLRQVGPRHHFEADSLKVPTKDPRTVRNTDSSLLQGAGALCFIYIVNGF